jgi:hypothetical protein
MKKPESFCTACEWQGDGTGLTACPVCGQPITSLDVGAEPANDEEYSEEAMKKSAEEDPTDI